MIKIKRIASLLLAIALCAGVLSGCGKETGNKDEEKETYLADGSIPASAKIYPVVDESFAMNVVGNEDNLISAEDIWTICHYSDVYCSINDTVEGAKKDELSKFLTTYTVEELLANGEAAGVDNKIIGSQILLLTVKDKDNVSSGLVLRAAPGPDYQAEEDAIYSLNFTRAANGEWFENGISLVMHKDAGTITWSIDPATGNTRLD